MLGYKVLGTLSVTRNGEPVDLSRPLERRLLALLLVNRSRALSDEQIFHALWPDGLPEYPGQALRTSASRLRRMLGTGDAIVRHGGGYRLVVETGSVDADRFESLIASAEDADRADRLREALDLWTSDEAYADFRYYDFAQAEAERLHALRHQAYETLVADRLAAGESEELVPDLQLMVKEHPLRERLYGLLMLALYRAGRQAEALRVFRVAKGYLGEELGLEPSQELVDLEERILLQDPGLDLVAGRSANNLPSRITSIVGRDATIEALVGHVRDRRLVTVTGPGGVGKTTVATEAARRIASAGHLDCWYLDLGPVTSGDQLAAYITDELASLLQQAPDGESQDVRLSQLIGAKQMLLVLDNCEHVIEAIGSITGTALRECPNLAVLTTSRERLGLIGELVFPVDPLFAGDGDDDLLDPQEAKQAYPALALLNDRCEAASPGFRLLAEDVPTALRLCRRLDGLPLAIELAAAQTTALSISDLERQLEGRLSILGAQRGAGARHRTLEAAIAWSYDRLDAEQQECLQLLARVSGPFTIAEVADLATGGDEALAAETIAALRDKSLVRASVEVSRTAQFEMLMTIREFARSRAAEAGRDHEHDLRHAHCFLAMAERANPHLLGGPHQLQWITRCTENTTDLLRATRTLIANDSLDNAMDLVARVGLAWTRYQIHLEAYPLMCEAFEAAGDVVFDSTPRAQVLAAWMSPDVPGRPFRNGPAHAREALRTATIVGDAESAIAAAAFVGLNLWLRGQSAEALDAVSEACRLADREDRSWAETTACIIAGIVDHAVDPAQPGHRFFERAVESARARSDEIGEAAALGYLGSALKDAGEYSRAAAAFHHAHLSGRRVGDPTIAIVGASGLALVAWLDGDPDGAALAADQALALMSGLTPAARNGSLSQLFLAPEPTYTLSELDEALSGIYARPLREQAAAFIRFLLELAESRALSHLEAARVAEIRAGLATLRAQAHGSEPAVTRR